MKRTLILMAVVSFMLVSCETKVKMTWQFTKALDQANPTISIYNHSSSNEVLTTLKLDAKVTSATVECIDGDKICYGGDFTLAGQEFEIGCGANCSSYSADRPEDCATCKETTVNVTFDNFLK